MKPIIEFCWSNGATSDESGSAYEVLNRDKNLDVVTYGCTSNCELCADALFCLVDGEIITAQSQEQLIKNVYQYLEDNPMF